MLLSPNYKGLIYDENGQDDIRLEIHPDMEALSGGKYAIGANLCSGSGDVIFESTSSDITDEIFFNFSSATLSEGDYAVNVFVENEETGEILDKDVHIIRKRSGSFENLASYVDEYGRYIKNGKPYFYIGMYGLNYDNDSVLSQFETIASDGKIDGVMSYWQSMSGTYSPKWYNKLSENGLGNIANMRLFCESENDRLNFKVKTYSDEARILSDWTKKQMNYPSLDMYYVGDEEAPEYNDRIRWHSEIISHYDLSRPTMFIDWRANKQNGFLRSSAADIVGIDYYPLTENASDIASISSRLKNFKEGVRNRPVFMVLQCANYDAINGNFEHDKSKMLPSYTHLMNMAMQSVCAGANGIMWYSYKPLMNDPNYTNEEKDEVLNAVKSVSGTIKDYSDVLLSVEAVPSVSANLFLGIEFEDYTVRSYNGKTYIFVVNTSTSAKSIYFSLSGIKDYNKAFSSGETNVYSIGNDMICVNIAGLGCAIIEV